MVNSVLSTEATWHGLNAGSWADWVAAIGTTAAFLVAAISWARSLGDQRAAQARLVYATRSGGGVNLKGEPLTWEYSSCYLDEGMVTTAIEDGEAAKMYGTPIRGGGVGEPDSYFVHRMAADGSAMLIRLHNNSSELILRWTATIWPVDGNDRESLSGMARSSVAPKTDDFIAFVGNNRFLQGGSMFVIYFKDSRGRYWMREEGSPVQRVKVWMLEPSTYWPEARSKYAKLRRWIRERRSHLRR